VLVVTNGTKQIRELYIFSFVLVLESLPFLAVAIAILEQSRRIAMDVAVPQDADQFVRVRAFDRGAHRRTHRTSPGGAAKCGAPLAAPAVGGPSRGRLQGCRRHNDD
jgi:hypothetical protein